MSNNLLNLVASSSQSLIPLLIIPLSLYYYYYHTKCQKTTKLTFYAHDYLTGDDTSAITVAGKEGPTTSPFHFGTLIAVDNPVTVGPDPKSKEIGRAQGMYINSQLNGRGFHMVFSVIFTDGDYKGSSLEIQGSDLFGAKEREFSVVSGTGHFRFVRGFAILTTEMMDVPNLRAVLKLHVTVKHY